ncbi:hypothetical protein [Lysobacter gummosus]|uniref:hypothetical protein n=1 Tax=Lysobacter gummosus TaxID=262324 RepID=UPI00362AE4C4
MHPPLLSTPRFVMSGNAHLRHAPVGRPAVRRPPEPPARTGRDAGPSWPSAPRNRTQSLDPTVKGR